MHHSKNKTMIRAEELSIGDWVNVLNYHWDGSTYTGQVKGITKKHGTYYLQFSSALSAEIDRCEPIPITPEILEKNGIRYQFGYPWWQAAGMEVGVFEIHITEKCTMLLKYVHQLQHAFKLCGINKNIEP